MGELFQLFYMGDDDMRNRLKMLVMTVLMVCFCLNGCSGGKKNVDYSKAENWAYCENDKTDMDADVFFICPTVYSGSEDSWNMAMDDEDTKQSFVGAINMEKGIYDQDSRFFAPYYRQAGLNAYTVDAEEREPYIQAAYEDVKEAFAYYMDHYNEGRPIVIAGFSQGGDLAVRLLKDCFDEEAVADLLVGCYAIGWSVTEEELKEYPHLKFASGEIDTGVIVAFECESEDVEDSVIIPKGTKTLAINPLNWKTDSTMADKTCNLGACFTDYSGEIQIEIPELTGAYIDPVRGALKATDVTSEEYPAVLDIFEDGVFHLYDYQFFYRNLQENVHMRIQAYLQ